jgi:PEGA domain-containing protein
MRKTVVLISLAVCSWVLSGAVKPERAIYSGGSAALEKGATGTIDLENAKDFRFQYDGGTFSVPYDRITSMEFGYKAGMKAQLAVAISWIPKVGSKQNHLLTIDYKDEKGTGQAAVFEISRPLSQTVIPVLESRTGKHVATPDEEDAKTAEAKKAEETPAPVSTLVPVTITSTPRGAFVSFWGQVAGQTPVTTKLAPGTYTVRLSASGLPDWTRDIVVESGKPLTVEAELGRPAATVASSR